MIDSNIQERNFSKRSPQIRTYFYTKKIYSLEIEIANTYFTVLLICGIFYWKLDLLVEV